MIHIVTDAGSVEMLVNMVTLTRLPRWPADQSWFTATSDLLHCAVIMRKAFHIYLHYYLHISSRYEGRPLPMCVTGAAEPADRNNNIATCCLRISPRFFIQYFT